MTVVVVVGVRALGSGGNSERSDRSDFVDRSDFIYSINFIGRNYFNKRRYFIDRTYFMDKNYFVDTTDKCYKNDCSLHCCCNCHTKFKIWVTKWSRAITISLECILGRSYNCVQMFEQLQEWNQFCFKH